MRFITVIECELHTLFQAGAATVIKTPFVDAFPSEFLARLERARARGLRPIPAWQPVGNAQWDELEAYIRAAGAGAW